MERDLHNRPTVQVSQDVPRVEFGLSPEKMVSLASMVRPLLEHNAIDITPPRLAAPLHGTKGRPNAR